MITPLLQQLQGFLSLGTVRDIFLASAIYHLRLRSFHGHFGIPVVLIFKLMRMFYLRRAFPPNRGLLPSITKQAMKGLIGRYRYQCRSLERGRDPFGLFLIV